MKATKKLLCLGFLLVLFLVPVLTLWGAVRNPSGWSVQENRALAGRSELSATALWTGETAAQTENFLKDHLYQRDSILKFGVWFQMRVLRRPVVDDVVLGSEVLLPVAEISDYRGTAIRTGWRTARRTMTRSVRPSRQPWRTRTCLCSI